jgi:hypothetical protein
MNRSGIVAGTLVGLTMAPAKYCRIYWLAALAAVLLSGPGVAESDTLEVVVQPITNTATMIETTPTIGDDRITLLVVFTRRNLVGGVAHPGDIYFQRVSSHPVTGIASVRAIAGTLELPVEELAHLWQKLPLDDNTLSERLGCTRQQVINLRMSARKRLTHRLAIHDRSSGNLQRFSASLGEKA